MTTGFIPCGAKMPIIGLFAGALFGGSSWVATSAYFIGVAAVILSGVILKKTRLFAGDFTGVTAYSFMIFNLLCAPCFAAMGAIKREMNSPKWTLGAIGYMCGFAYVISLMVYQLGGLLTGEVGFGTGTVAAILCLAALLYLLFRKGCQGDALRLRAVDALRA